MAEVKIKDATGAEVDRLSSRPFDPGAASGVPPPSETFPGTGGDVDSRFASQTAPKKPTGKAKETPPLILAGYWVILNDHSSVPEQFHGALAAIESSPWRNVPFDTGAETIHGYAYNETNTNFIVKTRDSANARLEVPIEAFAEWAPDRHLLEPRA